MLPLRTSLATLLVVCTVGITPADASAMAITRLSVADDGTQGDHDTFTGTFSRDGRYALFTSYASTLVPSDTNGTTDPYAGADVFMRDLVEGTITRISVATDGSQGSYSSYGGSISGDGRYVVFDSGARNFVTPDLNPQGDVFIRDLVAGTTSLVNVSATGQQSTTFAHTGRISLDGRTVAFTAFDGGLTPDDHNHQYDIVVKDLVGGGVEIVSRATDGTPSNGQSYYPSISGDGRYVVFTSQATNLVAGDTNAMPDVFLRDRVAGTTTLVHRAWDGTPANGWANDGDISADGRFLIFTSAASNIVPGDANGRSDAFILEMATGSVTRIAPPGGGEPNGQVSVGGVSEDARFIGLWSDASNLVDGDGNRYFDAFRYERETGEIARVSRGLGGGDARFGADSGATISNDGRRALFSSSSSDIVLGDTNDHTDLFLADLDGDVIPPQTTLDTVPPSPTRSTSVTLAFRSNEPATFGCSLDGAPFSPCTSPITYGPLGDGTHEFRVRATDASNNVDPTPAQASWKVDTTPPVASMRTPNPSVFVPPVTEVVLRAHATDPRSPSGEAGTGVSSLCFAIANVGLDGTHELTCADADAAPGEAWAARPQLGAGIYEVRARATDAAGNVGESAPIKIVVV